MEAPSHTTQFPHRLPESIRLALRRYRAGLWRQAALTRLPQGLALAGLVMLAGGAFDRLVDVPGAWRLPFPVLALIACLLPVARLLATLVRTANVAFLAQALDRDSEDPREQLRAALAFSQPHAPESFFTQASLQAATARWQSRNPNTGIDWRPARRWAAACLAGVALAAALIAIPDVRAGLLWRRFWNPTGNHMRPTATWFTFDIAPPGPWLTGDDLVITATLAGRRSAPTTPLLHVRRADHTASVRAFEPTESGDYRILIRQMAGSFEWHVTMGAVRSERHLVAVTPRPTVEQVTVTYHYPRYTRMAPLTETLSGRTLAALQGTRVQLTLHANVPLGRVEGTREDERVRFRIDRDDPRSAMLHRLIGETHQLHLELHSADGVAGKNEAPFTFRAIPDNPPTVSIVNDLSGSAFFLTDVIDIAYRAQDDLGLSALFLRALDDSIRPEPVVIDMGLSDYGTRHAESRMRIPVADLVRGETRTLQLSLQAQDSRGQDGLSPSVTIQIAADSFDLQLRKLLLSYNGQNSQQPETRGLRAPLAHEQRLSDLRTAANRTTMLADMLAPGQAPGAGEVPMVTPARAALTAARPPLNYGSWWFSDFIVAPLLPRFRTLGGDANVWLWLDSPAENLLLAFESALRASDPKPLLASLAQRLREAADHQASVLTRVQADQLLITRELAGYLAETSLRRIETAAAADWRDAEFLSDRRAALRDILRRIEGLPAAETPDATAREVLEAAVTADSGEAGFAAAVPVLKALTATLRDAAVREALARPASPLVPSKRMPMTAADDHAVTVLASGLLLDADAMDGDERLLLARAVRFLRLQAGGSAERQDDELFLEAGAPAGVAFDTFETLLRLRALAEAFRLAVSNGHLPPDSPQTETAWLRIREARLALLAIARQATPDFQASLLAIAERLSPFAAWLPAPDFASIRFLENLRQQEVACERLALTLLPAARTFLRHADVAAASHAQELNSALERYSALIDEEIAFFEKTHGLEFNNLHPLKVRLAGITVATLKLLDFARLAELHGVGGKADVEKLARIFVGLGRASRHFDEHVEAVFWTHRYGVHTRGIEDDMWRGKTTAYAKLREMIADVRLLAGPNASESADVAAAIDRLQIGFALRAKLQTLKRPLALIHQSEPPPDEAAEALPAVGDENPASRETALYLARLLRGRAAGEAETASPVPLHWRDLPDLPTDAKELFERLDDTATAPEGDTFQPFDDLIDRLHALLPARLSEPPQAPHVQQTFTFSVDWGAIRRSRQRQQERLVRDRLTLDRILLARTMRGAAPDGAAPDAAAQIDTLVIWACGELEVHRRKAGMALNRLELGAVATGADTTAVNLPDHIYRELRRAREGAMPELFRDQSFEYLNLILKKARP